MRVRALGLVPLVTAMLVSAALPVVGAPQSPPTYTFRADAGQLSTENGKGTLVLTGSRPTWRAAVRPARCRPKTRWRHSRA